MIYKDLALSLLPHPDTGDALVKTGANAIAQSISNLVLTNMYDRPFQPLLNSNTRTLLFNMVNPTTGGEIAALLLQTIKNNEPRVEQVLVDIRADEDNERYIVYLSYTVKSTGQKINQQLLLQRVR